jgi:hypothetical protein
MKTKTAQETACEKVWANREILGHIIAYRDRLREQMSGETHYDGVELGTALDNELEHFRELGLTQPEINWVIQSGIYRCWDDSCDGSHCAKCGGHFIGWHVAPSSICDSCHEAITQAYT